MTEGNTVQTGAGDWAGDADELGGTLITEELYRRPSRQPDFEAENCALVALAEAMSQSPRELLQKLVETALELCRADSAGISNLETGGDPGMFRWHVVAGQCAHNQYGIMPTEASPCGTILARDTVLLFDRPARHFRELARVEPQIFEYLVVPFHLGGRPAGTVWAVAHTQERKFDAEDARLLTGLSRFASAAYQILRALDAEQGRRDELERRVWDRTRELGLANESLQQEADGRRRAEETLRESEEHLRLAISIETVGVLFFDPEGTITDANEAFLKMSGYSREDLEQGRMRWDLMTPPEFMPASLKAIGQLFTTGETTPYEKQYVRKDGSRWWGLFAAKRLNEKKGVKFIIDRTERKRAEETIAADLKDTRLLRDLSARLVTEGDIQVLCQEIVTAAVGITHADAGTIQTLNENTHELVLLATQGFDRKMTEHFHRVAASYETSCGIALATGERTFVDFDKVEGTDPDGSFRMHAEAGYLSAQSTPLLARSGKPIGAFSTYWREHRRPSERELGSLDLLARQAADLIENNQTKQSLRASEAILAEELADTKQLQEISSLLIGEDNINALYNQILNAAISLMRSEMGSMQMLYPAKEELRLLAWKGFDPASAAFWEYVRVDSGSTCGVALRTGQRVIVRDVELCEFMAGTEDLRFYRLSRIRAVQSTPLVSRSGRIVGMISTHWRKPYQPSERQLRLLDVLAREAADLIERRQAEWDLLQHAEQLARSNVELEQFAHVASHDLQEPLRMVSLYTQLLARRYSGKLDKDADEFIGYVVQGAQRMHQLINDLLAYSRVSKQVQELQLTDCEVVLKDILADLRVRIEETQAEITWEELPTVTADRAQVEQLLRNLISNAVRFHGDSPPRVHVAAEPKAEEWRFSVRDHGIGIRPEFKEKIFVIFERLHVAEDYPGTGIGLAVCKRIVERHGGRIWVDSQAGQGATFYFTLPRRQGDGPLRVG